MSFARRYPLLVRGMECDGVRAARLRTAACCSRRKVRRVNGLAYHLGNDNSSLVGQARRVDVRRRAARAEPSKSAG
jgi:hypothetical protein